MGAVMLKASWHILDPDKDKSRHQAIPYGRRFDLFPGPAGDQNRTCLRRQDARTHRFPHWTQDQVRPAMGLELIRACQKRAE